MIQKVFKVFGLEISIAKALSPIAGAWRNTWRIISEPFTGAWQRNMEEKRCDLITYPTLYACLARISADIGMLPVTLRQKKDGVWNTVTDEKYSKLFKKPNSFQTISQFIVSWILAKLTSGNAYILKRKDARGNIIALYVLDSERVCPMVSESGAVFYQLNTDVLTSVLGTDMQITVPASEIIHDRCMPIFHPLIGIPPLAAAHWPALKNMKIMKNATEFFANNAQPGGILTAPAGMRDEDANAIKQYWNSNFTGANAGRVAVIGADMKFTPFAMKSIDSQMVEQMRYSDEQICQPFGVPLFKVSIGSLPAGLGVDGINQIYYSNALQPNIEDIERLLEDGLYVPSDYRVELDTSSLLRMDEMKRAEIQTKLVGGKIKTPDEGREVFNLPKTGGGNTLWGQNQDYPLGMLANREEWDQSMQKPVDNSAAEDATLEEAKAIIATNTAINALKKAMRGYSHV